MLVTGEWLLIDHGDLVPSCRFASSWTTRGERSVRTRAFGGAPLLGVLGTQMRQEPVQPRG
jgi:hypothetical protein